MFFKVDLSERQKTALWVSGCFFSTIFLFSPFILYVVNRAELKLSFADIVMFMVPLGLVLVLAGSLGIMALKKRFLTTVVALLLTVSFLFWLQGHVIGWPYGPLDREAVDWQQFRWVDSVMWVAFIAAAVLRPDPIYKCCALLSKALILMQAVFLAFVLLQMSGHVQWSKLYAPDPDVKFLFSKEQNVIVIVLDTFQGDVFQDIIEQDPEYRNFFDGFTYFRNALTPMNITNMAVAGIFTGKIYDNSVTGNEFIEKNIAERSLPVVLHDKGFRVDLFPLDNGGFPLIYVNKKICDNFKEIHPSFDDKIRHGWVLFKMAMLKHLPHLMKRYVYEKHLDLGGGGLSARQKIMADLEFASDARNNFRFSGKRGAFKFFHFVGPHHPLILREDLMIQEMKANRKNIVRQSKAYLKICSLFFDVLKVRGVYDNSLIFVLGDHGRGYGRDMHIRPVDDERSRMLSRASQNGNFQFDKARGIPLILVKRLYAKGRMGISDAPVTTADIPDTVMAELGLKTDFPGMSMFDVKDDCRMSMADPAQRCDRVRYYGNYAWKGHVKQIKDNYAGPITLYSVNGFSWDNSSWDVAGILFPRMSAGFSGDRSGSRPMGMGRDR